MKSMIQRTRNSEFDSQLSNSNTITSPRQLVEYNSSCPLYTYLFLSSEFSYSSHFSGSTTSPSQKLLLLILSARVDQTKPDQTKQKNSLHPFNP